MKRKVVIINPGHDTAGAGYALMQAFNNTPDWRARAVCRTKTYLRYPTDIVWKKGNRSAAAIVQGLVNDADVVHVMNSPSPLGWFTFRPEQTLVVHHLGSTFRRDPAAMSAICREYGAIEVTDSIDLLLGPRIGWLPIPADLDRLAKLRMSHYQPSSTIRIAHAPTDRDFKDTETIEAAVESLKRKYPITLDIIENVANRECLVRKARADIFVDQLRYGFGVNAIECWGMGIPVVSGLTTNKRAKRRGKAMWGYLPWADATEANLEAVVENLVASAEWRAQLGGRGRAHAEQWHSQESVVRQAVALYDQTPRNPVAETGLSGRRSTLGLRAS